MSASADVLAMAKVEVDLAAIPEGKNVRILRLVTNTRPTRLIAYRSLSSGVESQSSFDTEQSPRSRRPRTSRLRRSEIHKPMLIVSRSQSGSSWLVSATQAVLSLSPLSNTSHQVFAHTWDVSQSERLETLEDGSARVTVLTTIFLDVFERVQHHWTSRSQSTTSLTNPTWLLVKLGISTWRNCFWWHGVEWALSTVMVENYGCCINFIYITNLAVPTSKLTTFRHTLTF